MRKKLGYTMFDDAIVLFVRIGVSRNRKFYREKKTISFSWMRLWLEWWSFQHFLSLQFSSMERRKQFGNHFGTNNRKLHSIFVVRWLTFNVRFFFVAIPIHFMYEGTPSHRFQSIFYRFSRSSAGENSLFDVAETVKTDLGHEHFRHIHIVIPAL